MNDDGLDGLIVAIVQGVAKEYRRALKKGNESDIKYYERWFASDYGNELCYGKGDIICSKIREEVLGKKCDGKKH